MTRIEALHHSPVEAEWTYGQLPPVEEAAYDCWIMLWSPEYVGLVVPTGDESNPLRWGDHGGFPQWGIDRPVGWWTYLQKGAKPRPPEVKTWAEMYPPVEPGSKTEDFLETFSSLLEQGRHEDWIVYSLITSCLRLDGSIDPERFPSGVDVEDARVIELVQALKKKVDEGRK